MAKSLITQKNCPSLLQAETFSVVSHLSKIINTFFKSDLNIQCCFVAIQDIKWL